MSDWSAELSRRAAGLVPGFFGYNTNIAVNTSPAPVTGANGRFQSQGAARTSATGYSPAPWQSTTWDTTSSGIDIPRPLTPTDGDEVEHFHSAGSNTLTFAGNSIDTGQRAHFRWDAAAGQWTLLWSYPPSGGGGGGGGTLNPPNFTEQGDGYVAAPNDFVFLDTSTADAAMALPGPGVGQAPIWLLQNGPHIALAAGDISGQNDASIGPGKDGGVIQFVSGPSYWYPSSIYFPLANLARLDADNDFRGNVLKNYADDQANYAGATATIGTDILWGRARNLTNAGGCVITLPDIPPPLGSWVVLTQDSGVKVTINALTLPAFKVEADNIFTTAKEYASILIRCIDTAPGYLVEGYVG